MVDIIELALFRAVDLHVLGEERVEPQHVVPAVPHDLAVGVAPQEQVRHDRLPVGEAGHLRVRLPVEDLVQRMVRRLLLPVIVRSPVQMQRQLRHRIRQEPHAGIHGRDLHGGLFIHHLPAVGLAEHKQRPGVADIITDIRRFGSVPRIFESEPVQESHVLFLPPAIRQFRLFCHRQFLSICSQSSISFLSCRLSLFFASRLFIRFIFCHPRWLFAQQA